jgi:hypothetical protein
MGSMTALKTKYAGVYGQQRAPADHQGQPSRVDLRGACMCHLWMLINMLHLVL